MVDTARTQAALLALFADNTSGDISAQDARDMIVSVLAATGLQVEVKSTTGHPSSPTEGQLYANSTDNVVSIYVDGAWRDLGAWT